MSRIMMILRYWSEGKPAQYYVYNPWENREFDRDLVRLRRKGYRVEVVSNAMHRGEVKKEYKP